MKEEEKEIIEPIPTHEVKETHSSTIHYPDHPARSESAIYRKTRQKICEEDNIPCFVCDKKQPEVETEAHHFFCEWAAAGAINWMRFGKKAVNLHNPQTGQNIGSAFDWSAVAVNPTLFVDSEHNMLVLCPECHRSSHRGIHHIPFPEWILQAFPIDGYTFLE